MKLKLTILLICFFSIICYAGIGIGYSDTGSLPVELTTFSADYNSGGISLNWTTATEVNNHGFAVERSTVKGEWLEVGFIAGAGNSNSPKVYSFTDNTPAASTTLSYRLKQIDLNGSFTYSKEITVDAAALPSEYSLEQNYPNPFNPTTTISYQLPMNSMVTLKVYNVLGKIVAELVNENQGAGNYEVTFDASQLSSGIYFYQIQAGEYIAAQKMILMK
ncbi:MAG: T9SS type A sorting domain-containing protein [Ignavibacteria bacterium]|nr:T9SS type A sorting domain-containing protein [Ignavibacteria bacterium]